MYALDEREKSMSKIYVAPVCSKEFEINLELLLNSGWELTHLKFFVADDTQTGFAVLRRSQ